MKTKDKFYIWMNEGAVAQPRHFWNQAAQNWTTDPYAATFFTSRVEAEVEAAYADAYGPGEAAVAQATKDLPAR